MISRHTVATGASVVIESTDFTGAFSSSSPFLAYSSWSSLSGGPL